MTAEPAITAREHWVKKGPVRLFLWEKAAGTSPGPRGAILFVHGSSMASQPTFDLQIQGHPDASAMDYFTRLGYDTWCLDMEGYGRSDKHRAINADIANGESRPAARPTGDFRIAYHILHSFFSQPAPIYRGE